MTGAVVIVAAVLAQVMLVNRLPLPAGGAPDLVLLAVVGVAVLRGPAAGAVIGFCTGLLVDIKQTMSRLGMDARVVGSSTLVLPIADGRLHLGTWQRVLMYDPAEDADHSVTIHVVGE